MSFDTPRKKFESKATRDRDVFKLPHSCSSGTKFVGGMGTQPSEFSSLAFKDPLDIPLAVQDTNNVDDVDFDAIMNSDCFKAGHRP